MAVTCTCLNCQSVFQRSPSLVHARTFCSKLCRTAYSRQMLVCRGCGKGYSRDPKQPKRQYCTWECFKLSRHAIVTCVVCGVGFQTYLSEIRKREKNGHQSCCSASCRNSYTSRLLGGDGTWAPNTAIKTSRNRNRLGWRKTRTVYLKLVGDICEGCNGATVKHVHHLHPVSLGGSLHDFSNLMAVCVDCHENLHEQITEGSFWDSFEAAYADRV